MGNVRIVTLGEILKQYRIEHRVEDNKTYKQVTITKDGNVFVRGEKQGSEIGRKRQFLIDLEKHPNTLLFIRQTIWDGGIGMASQEVHGCIVTENFPLFSVSERVLPTFLSYFFRTFDFIQKLSLISTRGSAQQALHEREFLKIEIALPDLPTQKAIVARLQNLQTLHHEAIATLNNLKTNVTRLRQSILQDAIQGKLVDYKPEPGEKTGAELLADIRAEKERRAREAGKKLEAPLPPVTKEEMPFELPEGWIWCRLGNLATIKGGKRVPNGYKLIKKATPYIYLRVTDMQNGTILDNDIHYIDEFVHESIKQYKISKDDIYMTIVGGTIGKSGLVPEKFDNANLTENAAKISPILIEKKYLQICFDSNYAQSFFIGKTKRVAIQKMALFRFGQTPIPIPPLNEQREIVNSFTTRLSQCDQLELQFIKLSNRIEHLWKSELQQTFKFESNV